MILVVEEARWYAVSWVDWLNVVAFSLALLGLWLTFRQARDAKKQATAARTAAEAASTAVVRTQKQIRANQLLLLIPQLRWVAAELDVAISEDEPNLSRRTLDSWRWQAGQVHGLLTASSAERKLLRYELLSELHDAARRSAELPDPWTDPPSSSLSTTLSQQTRGGKVPWRTRMTYFSAAG